MGQQIRRGVFETNSSSTHSISVFGSDRFEYLSAPVGLSEAIYKWVSSQARVFGVEQEEVFEYLGKYLGVNEKNIENTILLSGGEYDWEYDTLVGPIAKLNYLFTYIAATSSVNRFIDDPKFKMLKEVVKDYADINIAPDFLDIENDLSDYGNVRDFYDSELRYFIDNASLEGFYYNIDYYGGSNDLVKEISFWNNHIYIDHQSLYLVRDCFDSKEKLKDIIFNERYCIVIDNDNH